MRVAVFIGVGGDLVSCDEICEGCQRLSGGNVENGGCSIFGGIGERLVTVVDERRNRLENICGVAVFIGVGADNLPGGERVI